MNSPGGHLERLRSFFAAENARDWSKYAEFLHPDVEWFIFDTPGGRVVQGRSRYLDEMVQAYAGSAATFEAELTVVDPAAGRIAAVLVSSTARRSIDIFEFEDELIRREWEFYEPPSSSSGEEPTPGAPCSLSQARSRDVARLRPMVPFEGARDREQ